MPKRRTPNYKGLLQKPISPWDANASGVFEEKCDLLIANLGIDHNAPQKYENAYHALCSRHNRSPASTSTEADAKQAFMQLAHEVVPGFQSAQRNWSIGEFLSLKNGGAGSTKGGRPPNVPDPITLVHSIRFLRALDERETIESAVFELLGNKESPWYEHNVDHRDEQAKLLIRAYYRHAKRVPEDGPPFPYRWLCAAAKNGETCLDSCDVDEVEDACQQKPACALFHAFGECKKNFDAERADEFRAASSAKKHHELTASATKARARRLQAVSELPISENPYQPPVDNDDQA